MDSAIAAPPAKPSNSNTPALTKVRPANVSPIAGNVFNTPASPASITVPTDIPGAVYPALAKSKAGFSILWEINPADITPATYPASTPVVFEIRADIDLTSS